MKNIAAGTQQKLIVNIVAMAVTPFDRPENRPAGGENCYVFPKIPNGQCAPGRDVV